MAVQRSTGAIVSGFTAWTNGTVRSIVSDGASLYIGGDFTIVNGEPRNRVAKLEPVRRPGPNFEVRANKPVRDLHCPRNATLYLVGDFTTIRGHRPQASRGRGRGQLARACPSTPTCRTRPTPSPSRRTNRLYVGGNFTTVGGAARSFLTQVNAVSGAMLGQGSRS